MTIRLIRYTLKSLKRARTFSSSATVHIRFNMKHDLRVRNDSQLSESPLVIVVHQLQMSETVTGSSAMGVLYGIQGLTGTYIYMYYQSFNNILKLRALNITPIKKIL